MLNVPTDPAMSSQVRLHRTLPCMVRFVLVTLCFIYISNRLTTYNLNASHICVLFKIIPENIALTISLCQFLYWKFIDVHELHPLKYFLMTKGKQPNFSRIRMMILYYLPFTRIVYIELCIFYVNLNVLFSLSLCF